MTEEPASPEASPPKPRPDAAAGGFDWTGAEPTLRDMPSGAPPEKHGQPAPELTQAEIETQSAAPPVASAAPAVKPPAAVPAAATDWKGDDLTMMPEARSAVDGEAQWTGAEPTMAGTPAAPAGDAPAGPGAGGDSWSGAERTMAGTGAAAAAAVVARSTESTGSGEQQGGTESGTGSRAVRTGTGTGTGSGTGAAAGTGSGSGSAADSSQPGATPASRSKSRSRIGTKNTSLSFDDAWHMEGRHGPHTGESWGDWQLGGILGEGGMGAVYRAKQSSLKRRVAIKVLSPALAADFKLLQRFQLEARMTSMLSSPNLVQVFAAGEWEGNHFFVMEYIDGTDLYQVIKERQKAGSLFKPDEAADVILQATRGLAEAGRYGMVHRDIKPANLMVTRQGLVKVADFGIVKVMGEASLTMTGQAVGTPSYVSPEQGRGQLDIDQRADFYSLGVVFYELLCNKKPFEATSPNALIYQHCYAEPELPRTLNPEISEAYQAVVLKCLQKKPENRYQSAEELIKDLDGIRTGNLLQSALINYRQGTGAEEAQRENLSWAQRHLLQLVSGMIVLLIAIGLAGFAYVKHYQESQLEARNLYTELSALDSPQPIPRGAEQDLVRYASLPGSDQNKVKVWGDKLQRVAALRVSLGQLDSDKVSNDIRQSVIEDLALYRQLVGVNEPQGIDWGHKIDALKMSESELRDSLRLLDQKTDLSDAEFQALSPKLDALATIVGADDPQVVRCRKRLSDYDQLKEGAINRLSVLDNPSTVVGDQQRLRLQGDLATLELMLGKQDARVQGWSRRLVSSSEQVSNLRIRLRVLDKVDLPTVSMQRDLDRDLAAIQELIDKDDPELRGWLAKIAAANAEIDSLRKRLGGMDAVPYLRPSQVPDNQRWLASLNLLLGESDADSLRWSAKIQASQSHVLDLQSTVNRIQSPEEMTVDEMHRVGAAVAELDTLVAISPEQHNAALRRVARDQQLLDARHQRLADFDRAVPITAAMRADLATYLRQVPLDDPDARRWNAKLGNVDALYAQLADLDRAAPLVENAQSRLERLVSLVSDQDPAVVRWRAKIKRVAQIEVSLRSLDQVEPLPADADQELTELAGAIGTDGADYQRWRAKTTAVLGLRSRLQVLPTTLVLSVEAASQMQKACDRLAELVGRDDPDLSLWQARLIELTGPGRPGWANRYGHDQFGPVAGADLLGVPVRFRFVPSGQFIMGSPDNEVGRDSDERQVQVTLSKGFWLAEGECTQELWLAVMKSNPSRDTGKDFPVNRVSWLDCESFLQELNRQVGHGISARLPTEAEWEFACRAGGTAPFTAAHTGQESLTRTAEEMSWYEENANGKAHQIRQRVPNQLGLYDVQGNVAEWCFDHYAPYPTVPAVDPVGVDGELFVVRGGSWGDPLKTLRAANRIPARQDIRSAYLGLRIAIDLAAADSPSETARPVAAPLHAPAAPVQAPLPVAAPAPTSHAPTSHLMHPSESYERSHASP